jgi:hypothetical protein
VPRKDSKLPQDSTFVSFKKSAEARGMASGSALARNVRGQQDRESAEKGKGKYKREKGVGCGFRGKGGA